MQWQKWCCCSQSFGRFWPFASYLPAGVLLSAFQGHIIYYKARPAEILFQQSRCSDGGSLASHWVTASQQWQQWGHCLALHEMILNQKDHLAYVRGAMNRAQLGSAPKAVLAFFPGQQLKTSVKLCEGTWGEDLLRFFLSHFQCISIDFNKCLELVGGRFGSSSSVAGSWHSIWKGSFNMINLHALPDHTVWRHYWCRTPLTERFMSTLYLNWNQQ